MATAPTSTGHQLPPHFFTAADCLGQKLLFDEVSAATAMTGLPSAGALLAVDTSESKADAIVTLGLCLLRRVDPDVLARGDNTDTNKLLLAATTVAMKAHFDDFYVNKYMARIGGLETAKELGELEAHMFLTLLGGRAQVSLAEVVVCDRQWRDAVGYDATPSNFQLLPTAVPSVADVGPVSSRSGSAPEQAAVPSVAGPHTIPTLRGASGPAAVAAVPFSGLSDADRRRARATGRSIVAALNRSGRLPRTTQDGDTANTPFPMASGLLSSSEGSVGSDSAFRPPNRCERGGHRRRPHQLRQVSPL